MARARDEGLDIDVFHAKGRLRLGPAALEGALKVRRVADNPRAAPAATGEGLDDHRLSVSREADEECSRFVEADAAVDAPRYRDAGCNGRRSSAGLVPEQRQMLDLGADEGDARGSAPFRELGALGEESITWVDCVAAIRKRRLDHRVHVEVGARATGLQGVGHVGHASMQAGGIVLRIDRHRAQSEIPGGAGDADGDLAAIGDQNRRDLQGGS